MKLEPVYLLAPKPKPPSIPSRRAFLIAGGTFLAGVGLGGACGYAVGVGGSGEVDNGEGALKPTGDPLLDELRRLAVKAPIDELMEKHMPFLDHLTSKYAADSTLWGGVERICQEVISNPRIASRRSVAGWLATVISRGDPALTGDLRNHVVELKRLK